MPLSGGSGLASTSDDQTLLCDRRRETHWRFSSGKDLLGAAVSSATETLHALDRFASLEAALTMMTKDESEVDIGSIVQDVRTVVYDMRGPRLASESGYVGENKEEGNTLNWFLEVHAGSYLR